MLPGFMVKTVATMSITTTALTLTFGLCVYLIQVEFSDLKLSAEEIRRHKIEYVTEISSLRTADAVALERISMIEKKIDSNTERLDKILNYLARLK